MAVAIRVPDLGVTVDERVQALFDHLLDRSSHSIEVEGEFDRGRFVQREGPTSDIDGQITDALEIIVQLEDGDDEPQVTGDGLVESENLQAVLLDVDFHDVDSLVRVDYLSREVGVTLAQGENGIGEVFLDQSAEFEDPRL